MATNPQRQTPVEGPYRPGDVPEVRLGASVDVEKAPDPLLRGWRKLDAVLEVCSPYILAGCATYLVIHALVALFR